MMATKSLSITMEAGMAETEGTEGAGVTEREGSVTGAGTSLADMEEMTGWASGIRRAVA